MQRFLARSLTVALIASATLVACSDDQPACAATAGPGPGGSKSGSSSSNSGSSRSGSGSGTGSSISRAQVNPQTAPPAPKPIVRPTTAPNVPTTRPTMPSVPTSRPNVWQTAKPTYPSAKQRQEPRRMYRPQPPKKYVPWRNGQQRIQYPGYVGFYPVGIYPYGYGAAYGCTPAQEGEPVSMGAEW